MTPSGYEGMGVIAPYISAAELLRLTKLPSVPSQFDSALVMVYFRLIQLTSMATLKIKALSLVTHSILAISKVLHGINVGRTHLFKNFEHKH